jgi:hypothetical protein
MSMTGTKTKTPAAVQQEKQVADTPGRKSARQTLQPSINAAVVMMAYQGNIVGKDVDLEELVGGLLNSFEAVKEGDMSGLEAMLVGQATALQSLFTSLTRRAQVQTSQRNLEAFLGLALKAQAQSRATIQAVVELKYPKQVAFVRQANISHGPQQINNGLDSGTATRTEENQTQQTKLLARQSDGSTYLDTGATTAAGRSHTALETVEAVHRPDKRRR